MLRSPRLTSTTGATCFFDAQLAGEPQPKLETAQGAELQEEAAGAVGAVVIDASDDELTDMDESEAITVE
jgi:hypothetical protein